MEKEKIENKTEKKSSEIGEDNKMEMANIEERKKEKVEMSDEIKEGEVDDKKTKETDGEIKEEEVENKKTKETDGEIKEEEVENKKTKETDGEIKEEEVENKKIKETDGEIKEGEDKKKIESKKSKEKEIPKKEFVVARGINVHSSTKHFKYICSHIKGRKIDNAISEMESVLKYKVAVPFKGEIPHRKGMMSGRYPVKASGEMIKVLKALKGNALNNNMDIDKTIIFTASANIGKRPAKRKNRKGKRTHIALTAKEIVEKNKEKINKN
jgi:ribosomal protein L22